VQLKRKSSSEIVTEQEIDFWHLIFSPRHRAPYLPMLKTHRPHHRPHPRHHIRHFLYFLPIAQLVGDRPAFGDPADAALHDGFLPQQTYYIL
jgi:hypothetical protein